MGEGEYQEKFTEFNGVGSPVTACGADPRRVYIGFQSSAGSGNFRVQAVGRNLANGGWNVGSGTLLELFFRRHGTLPSLAYSVPSLPVNSVLTVIELIYLGPPLSHESAGAAGDE